MEGNGNALWERVIVRHGEDYSVILPVDSTGKPQYPARVVIGFGQFLTAIQWCEIMELSLTIPYHASQESRFGGIFSRRDCNHERGQGLVEIAAIGIICAILAGAAAYGLCIVFGWDFSSLCNQVVNFWRAIARGV